MSCVRSLRARAQRRVPGRGEAQPGGEKEALQTECRDRGTGITPAVPSKRRKGSGQVVHSQTHHLLLQVPELHDSRSANQDIPEHVFSCFIFCLFNSVYGDEGPQMGGVLVNLMNLVYNMYILHFLDE